MMNGECKMMNLKQKTSIKRIGEWPADELFLAFVIHHSSFVILHSSFCILHSAFIIPPW